MVKVRAEQPLTLDGGVDVERWIETLIKNCPKFEVERIRQVCDLSMQAEEKAIHANQVWSRGRSSFLTGLAMADILIELRVDEDGIVAAIIYRAVRENQLTLNHVKKQFGAEVAKLVQGVLRMAAISDVQFSNDVRVLGESSDQLEQARRMLVSLVDDVRVVLIKLAERTCVIRTIADRDSEKRQKLAREVFEIYTPLAHRLGIGHLKWELEDLSFRYLEPTGYKKIATLLDGKRTERQEYITEVIGTLSSKLRGSGIEAGVKGRAKHIYSIWRKMAEKGIPFSQVYDVRAVRVLVPEVKDCYTALYIVHSLWRTIAHEFDDYIAAPKENGYRSLHTAVIGPNGKVLEVQIRTHEMHEEAEYGVCSHWTYKSGDGNGDQPRGYEEKINWLRQILEQEDSGDYPDLARELISEVDLERIYVYTPEGHVVDMHPGVTPIDFAYRVHTEVGHRCRGAKINGRVVPLNTNLKSGDQIEVITGEDSEPRREWLYDHLGYVTTSRARSKIRSWFGHQSREKTVLDGKRRMLDELTHLAIEQIDLEKVAAEMEFNSADELFAAIGAGSLDTTDVLDAISGRSEFSLDDQQLSLSLGEVIPAATAEVLVSGVGDIRYELPGCCQPVPGDEIVGVVDESGELVLIHRQDCLAALKGDIENRVIKVTWIDSFTRTFPVKIEVTAFDRPGLLFDITGILFTQNNNVISVETHRTEQDSRLVLNLTIEIDSLNSLLKTLEKIERLNNVIEARRQIVR